MNFLISGYGTDARPTIVRYHQDQPTWTSSIENPSYLCETDPFLFAAGEFDDYCTITSFTKAGDNYCQKDTIRLEGTSLCHLDVHPKQRFLTGSCWGNGLFFMIRYHADGTFGDIVYQEYQTDGTGRTSRVHCSLILDDWIYAVNIELDLIICYHLEHGIPAEYSRLTLPSGTGPRHIYANREKQLFYCVTEYSSELLTIDYSNPKEMRLISALSLLDSAFTGDSYGSTLAVTKNLHHLYAANRGENTIAHFLLDEDGMPRFSDRTSCLGNWPRDITLMDQEQCLAIANQKSEDVVFVKRDVATGKLSSEAFLKIAHPQVSFVMETA